MEPTVSPRRDRASAPCLAAILALAVLLRVPAIDPGPYDAQDDVQLQIYVLDSLPRAGGLARAFTSVDHVAVGNPLRLVAYPLSALLPLVAFAAVVLCDWLAIPLDESTWAKVAALPGALGPVVAFALVRRLAGRTAGILAALLLATTPLHVMLSRSLAAAWVLAFLLECLTLLALFPVIEGRPGAAPRLGLALAAYVLCHNQFPSLVPVLLFAALALEPGPGTWTARGGRALRRLGTRWVLVPPLAVLALLVAVHVAFDLVWVPRFRSSGPAGVGLVGHMLQRGAVPGLYLSTVVRETARGFGLPLALGLVATLAAWAAGVGRSRASAVLAVWSAAYLFPFAFLLAPAITQFRGYLCDGLLPLVLLGGVVLGAQWDAGGSRRLAAALAAALLAATGAATSWATVRQALPAPLRPPALAALVLPPFHGCRSPDSGIRAAAAWLREATPPGARLFTVGLDPRIVRYYSQRHTTGLCRNRRDLGGARACLARVHDQIDVVVLDPALAPHLGAGALAGFRVAAEVRDRDQVRLRLLVRVQTMEAAAGPLPLPLGEWNARFAGRYASVAAMTPLAEYAACEALAPELATR